MEETKTKRLSWVDGLKGLCALIVVIDHVFANVSGVEFNHSMKTPILHNLWDGNFAVSVFIILSTILTCHGFSMRRAGINEWYSNVVLKRYFRILIPTGFVMFLMFAVNLAGLYADGVGTPVSLASFVHLPGNILFAPLGGGFDILFVTWMLKYVFLGTMWTVILDLLLYRRRVVSQLLLLAFCCYFASKIDFYYVNVVVGYAIYNVLTPCLKTLKWGGQSYLRTNNGSRICPFRFLLLYSRMEYVASYSFSMQCSNNFSAESAFQRQCVSMVGKNIYEHLPFAYACHLCRDK